MGDKSSVESEPSDNTDDHAEATPVRRFLAPSLLDPEEAATVAVEALPAAADDWDDFTERFERELEASGEDLDRQAMLHHQLAVAAEGRRGDRHKALFHLQRALELAPRNLVHIRAAQQAYRQRQSWAMLLRLIDAELALTAAPADQARLWREKGQIFEDWLADEVSARAAYREALQADAGDLAALQRLCELLRHAGDEEALVAILRRAISVTEDRRLRAVRYAEIGAIQQADHAASLDSYIAAYAEDPANEEVRSELKRLYEGQDNWSALVDVLVGEAESVSGGRRVRCYEEAGRIARDRLGQSDRALQLLSRACEENDSDPALLRELVQLYGAIGRYDELAGVYTRLLAHVGEREAAEVHYQLALVLDRHLGRAEDALEHCRRAVELAPRQTQAVFVLERLCRGLGQWEEVVQLSLQRADDLESAAERASSFAEAADLCERHLKNLPRAVEYHQRALLIFPGYGPSMLALESLYQREGAYECLLELLESGLDGLDEDAIVIVLVRMAMTCECLIGDVRRAIEYYQRALEVQPQNAQLAQNVRRLLRDAGAHKELVESLSAQSERAEDSVGHYAWALAAARTVESELMSDDDATARYERLVERFPRQWTAIQSLARRYEQQQRWEPLLELLERAISSGAVPKAHTAAIQYYVGELAEQRVTQLDRAEQHYRAAIDADGGHELAVRALERLYRADHRWDALRDMLVEQAATTTPYSRPHPWYAIGQLCEAHLGRAAEATDWYRRAVDRDPADSVVREALLARLSAEGRAEEAVRVLEQAIDACDDEHARAVLRTRLAQLWVTELQRPAKAAECLEAVLLESEPDLALLDKVAQLYRQAGDFARLVDTLERLAASTEDAAERARILEEAARLAELHLPDADPAPLYEAVLQQRPHDKTTLDALLRLYSQRGDHVGLAHAVELTLPLCSAPEERAARLLQLALCRERAGDLVAAEEALEQASTLPMQWVSASELLRVRRKLGGGRRLGDALRRAAELSGDQRNATMMLLSAAQAYAEEDAASDQDLALLAQLGQLDPFHEPAARQQEQLLAAREDWQGLAEAMRVRLDAARVADDGRRPERRVFRVATLIRLARLHREKLQQPEVAVQTLREANELDAGNTEALTLRAEIHGELAQWDAAAKVYEQVVTSSDDATLLAHAHFQLGRIWQDRLGDSRRAVSALQNVLAVNPQDCRAMRRLSRLFLAAGDWQSAADTVQRLLEVDSDSAAQRQHHLTLADILEQGFGDPEAAAERLEMALMLDQTDEAVVKRLAQINGRLGRWQQECDVIRRYLAALPADRRMDGINQRMRLAEVLQRHDRAADALEHYAELVRLDPSNVGARLARAGLLTEQGQYESAVDAYRQVLSADPLNQSALTRLRSIWWGLGSRELAYACASVLVCCGLASEGDRRVYRQHRRGAVRAPDNAIDQDSRSEGPLGPGDSRSEGPLGPGDSRSEGPLGPRDSRSEGPLGPRDSRSEGPLGPRDSRSEGPLGRRDSRSEGPLGRRDSRSEGSLGPGDFFAATVIHPDEPAAGRALITTLSSVAHRLRPVSLQRWKVGRGDRLSQRSDEPLREIVRQVSRAFGIGYEVEVYLSPIRSRDVELLCTDPPALVVGHGVLAALSSREMRFWIADLLAYVASRNWVMCGSDERDLRHLVAAAWEVVAPPGWISGIEQTPETSEMARQLRRSLSRRGRRALEDAVHALADLADQIDFARWARAIRCTSLRAALWVVNDLGVALNYLRVRDEPLTHTATPAELGRAIKEHPVALDLIHFWLSDRRSGPDPLLVE